MGVATGVPRVTLEQWRTLQAIVDHGGFAQAAEALHRSQSSVSYAVRRIQEHLGLEVLVVRGRRAELTEPGRILLDRARQLLGQASSMEAAAQQMAQGWEANIQLVVESVFPTDLLLETLKRFEPESRGTRVNLREEVLSGVEDVISEGLADLAISPVTPAGFLYDTLTEVRFVAVAHVDHALHHLPHKYLGLDDLKNAIHIVIRDSGGRARDAGWVQNEHKWTVGSFSAATDMVAKGLGFAWLPLAHVQPMLIDGSLRPLRLQHGGRYAVPVNLIYAGKGGQGIKGPATQRFVDILKSVVKEMALVGEMKEEINNE